MPSTKHRTNAANLRKSMVENEHETRAPDYPFGHHQLDVSRGALDMAFSRIALNMACRCRRLADRVPRGYCTFADELLRSAGQTVLFIGEGANPDAAGQKRQRYIEAQGRVGEVPACHELFGTLRLVP